MQSEKPAASFWFRLLSAGLTILGAALVLSAALSMNGFLTTSLPLVSSTALNLSGSQISIVANIRHFAFIAAALLTGYYGGRVGWRRLALAGLIVLAMSAAASGLMTTVAGLGATYFIAGVGCGILLTALIVLILRGVGSHWLLASATALYFAVKILTSLASAFGFVLIQRSGAQNSFLTVGGAGLGVGLVGMGLLFLALLTWRARSWPEAWLEASAAPARPGARVLILAAVFLVSWAGLAPGWAALYAVNEIGMRNSELGLVYGAVGAAAIFAVLASFASGWLADLADWLMGRSLRRGFGRLAIFALGVLILSGGFVFMLFARQAASLSGALITIQLGLAVLSPPLAALLFSHTPVRNWGLAAGLFLAAEGLGQLGSIVNGAAIQTLGYQSPSIIGVVISLAALVLVGLICLGDRKIPPATSGFTPDPAAENAPPA